MNKIRNRKNNKGFSLVELIIVIAIMAILAGILIPQFVKYISSSKVSGDIQQAEKLLFVQWFVVFEGVNVLLKLFKI